MTTPTPMECEHGQLARSCNICELERELAAAQAELAQEREWREAVLNELIAAHIYSKEHETNPRKAVQDAIIWNCQVALDPAVSTEAQSLIKQERERAELAEARAEALRQREETFRALIADDAYAASFQTLGQFRTSILGWIDERNDIDAIAEGKKP